MPKIHKLGFTLIEILFVIAILSVIASLGISVLQQRAQQAKIERTALQMQQLLQAGMAYKSDSVKQEWPTCDPQQTPDFDKYRPTGLMGNPWGYSYTCGKNDPKVTFIVKVKVPTEKIADQIIALLPNAGKDTTTDPKKAYVFTEVSGAGGAAAESIIFKEFFKDITIGDFTGADTYRFDQKGVFKFPYTVPISCPKGMNGHLLFFPLEMTTGDYFFTGSHAIKTLEYDDGCGESASPNCTPIVTFQSRNYTEPVETIRATSALNSKLMPSYTHVGKLVLRYVSYCVKPPPQ